MKKIIALLLAVLLVVGLAACGAETEAEVAEGSGKMKVVLLMAKSTSPYSGAYFQEFKDYGAKFEDIEWIAFDAQSDMTLQSQQADEAIAMAPDLICLQPVDSVAAVAVAKKVHDAGIPFVNVNTSVTVDGMGSYPYDEAQTMGIVKKYAKWYNVRTESVHNDTVNLIIEVRKVHDSAGLIRDLRQTGVFSDVSLLVQEGTID